MLSFTPNGPFAIPAYVDKAGKTITSAVVQQFWKEDAAFASCQGCYVFGIRSGGGITPFYVGKATKSFKQEAFTPHKIAKYQQALAASKKGTPVIFFNAAPTQKGAVNKSAIAHLETFLIQTAASSNRDLLNVKGTKQADWAIAGIVRSGVGKPSAAAQKLGVCLGIKRPKSSD
jgi:hypothetical protein